MPRKPSGSGVAFRAHLLSRLNFSLVSKTGPPCRGRALGEEGALFAVLLLKIYARGSKRGGRGGFTITLGAAQRGGRSGWRDWDKVSSRHVSLRMLCPFLSQEQLDARVFSTSVSINPSWQILEEIEFHRLAKLRHEVNSTSPQL
jgi:translation initiation factor 3 subunit D